MSIEEEYEDVLHNLESAIVMYYRDHPDLIDAEVETALDWLIKLYSTHAQGKSSSARQLKGVSGEVAEEVKRICEWRLGREPLEMRDEKGNPMELEIESLKPSEIVACLKRIKSSIKLWTKKGGRQGYLDFVKQYIPPEKNRLKEQRNSPIEKILGLFKRQ
jgi:hypothetical protein